MKEKAGRQKAEWRAVDGQPTGNTTPSKTEPAFGISRLTNPSQIPFSIRSTARSERAPCFAQLDPALGKPGRSDCTEFLVKATAGAVYNSSSLKNKI
jgi:hypothetical protein